MKAIDKKQAPVRFDKNTWNSIQKKCKEDGISYQKLMEILTVLYLKRNSEVMEHVKKHINSKKNTKKEYELDDMEFVSLLDKIEKDTPVR